MFICGVLWKNSDILSIFIFNQKNRKQYNQKLARFESLFELLILILKNILIRLRKLILQATISTKNTNMPICQNQSIQQLFTWSPEVISLISLKQIGNISKFMIIILINQQNSISKTQQFTKWKIMLPPVVITTTICPFVLFSRIRNHSSIGNQKFYIRDFNQHLSLAQRFQLNRIKIMGGCLSGLQPIQKACYLEGQDKTQEDSSPLPSDNSSLLTFRAIISKIKLRNCEEMTSYRATLRFGAYQQFDVSTKTQEEGIIEWENEFIFSFEATQRNLKEEYLQLLFFNQKSQNNGSIKVNLFSLATGPSNQDFSIKKDQVESPRISFRVQLLQEVAFRFEVKEAQMVPTDKEFPGDIFAFGLNSAIGNKIEESKLSYKYLISLDQLQSQKLAQSKIKSRKLSRKQTLSQNNVMTKLNTLKKAMSSGGDLWEQKTKQQIEENIQAKKVKWSFGQGKQLPFIQAVVPLSCLHSINFNIVFYSFTLKNKSISSQCFISFNKFLNFQAKEVKDEGSNKVFFQQDVNLNLRTWSKGKQVGNAKFLFFFRVQKHYRQMQMCVRNQSGIIESSLQCITLQNYRIPQNIVELEKISKKIQKHFIKLTSLKSRQQKKDWIQQLNQKLTKQKEMLQRRGCQSDYADKQALLQGQRRLCQFGKKVIEFLDEGIEQIQQNCWDILLRLIKREELIFRKMSFQQNDIDICLSGQQNQFLMNKKEVSKQYYKLISQLLQRTLQTHQYYSSKAQRQFSQQFLPYAYFRIPLFRNHFLKNIARDSDQQHFQYEQIYFEKKQSSSLMQSRFTQDLDQERKFCKVLQTEQDIVLLERRLSQIIQTSIWQEKLRKRGKAFFTFIKYWLNYIATQCQTQQKISWNYIPGYTKILIAFISQIKNKSIQDYSDQLKQTWVSFTCNSELLNTFIVILYQKTNKNNSKNLVTALELISTSFGLLAQKNKGLSTGFDYSMFFKGIKVVLQGQSKAAIERMLILLYEHFQLFSTPFKNQLISYLLGDAFYRLFLHWSFQIRIIFHQFIIAKISISYSQKNDKQSQDQIKLKNQNLSKLGRLLETLKHHSDSKQSQDTYNPEKQLYKTIKAKLQNKMKYINRKQPKKEISVMRKQQQIYLCRALEEYNKIKDTLTNLEPNNDINDIPAIRIKQALDQRELRPEQYP